jgi:hypothetical protein
MTVAIVTAVAGAVIRAQVAFFVANSAPPKLNEEDQRELRALGMV